MPEPSRRTFLATSAAAAAVTAASSGVLSSSEAAATTSGGDAAIRKFRVNVPDSVLTDLRHRIKATRWPAKETVNDQAQGVQLAKLQELVHYWGSRYDWRKIERKLNAQPQFVTRIDGLDIHFTHIRSKHANALPLIITHGWPGSILELQKVIGPLTDPTSYGGRAADAFHLVIPSMPGYGFSEQPKAKGWNADRIGLAWDVLMKRLGYSKYVSQGGDWGAVVSDKMARRAFPGLLGIHVNMPATVPADVAKALNDGDPAPAGLGPVEKKAFDTLKTFYTLNAGYSQMMATRPQTLGYGLTDSPAGLAAWMYDKFAQWTYSGGDPERSLTKDEMLDDITLYWVTNSEVSSSQLYLENGENNFNAVDISIPAAITVFPGEIYQTPRSWADRAYHDLIYFNEVDKGGHFAAWEEPELFSREIRAAFRSLR
ncbi:epoxide hydrolase family protein [Streptomyces sp. SID13031]|uniref:epoxide hydrolase family protein n=1 Tax=Streptomyces sp. SID13031 TaxID=2706046 RepID=UPI0013CA9407|nr:epoxide hydrolase family protein [Streptomyces sp. SID13031]NEA34641.1 epoxide hydrolase [Streptomyces sp. SID13031]